MNTDFDALVRESMRRFTDGIEFSQSLADRAGQRVRQRRRRTRRLALVSSAAGAGSLIAASVTLGLPLTASGPPHRVTGIQTTARVIQRVDSALAAVQASRPVEAVIARGFPDVAINLDGPYQARVGTARMWSRAGQVHIAYFAPDGKLVAGVRDSYSRGTSVVTTVDYQHRTWLRSRSHYGGSARLRAEPAGCLFSVVAQSPAQAASQIRRLLHCDHVTIAGRQRIDGIAAIKIVLHVVRSKHRICTAGSGSIGPTKSTFHCTAWTNISRPGGILWVASSDYLPVRFKPTGLPKASSIGRMDFRWLPPTRANLARLQMPIPAGFRHI